MKAKITLLFTLLLLGFANYTFADYPIMSHSYLADPGAIWYEGRLYVYCSNDNENAPEGGSYDMSSIVCVSSADLKNWTDHGIVFDVPRDASWTGLSWAPSPAYKNGLFYLYFGNGGSAIGVAVADNPLGTFVDPVGHSIASGSTPGVQPFDGWLFDPMTFVDDDGQAYMYFGGNGDNNMRVARLNEDMVSINGSCQSIIVPNLFEAAWLHKYDGRYYFSYSTNPSNGMRIDYMVSDDPMTGFTYGGIMSNQPPVNNNNNHQAVVEINGQWYQVYHNRIVAQQNGDEMPYHRNLAIDAFSHNADGSIETMENTVDGVQQIQYLDPFIRQEGETFSDQSGINTEVCDAGGMDLAYIDDGDWTMIEGVDFGTAGATSFSASVASPTGGTIEIRVGSTTGTLAGTLQVPNTGGYQTWQTETVSINNISGVHNVYFVYSTGGFNFDHWMFSDGGPSVIITTPEDAAIYAAPVSVPVDVEVSVEEGSITHIEFYMNDETSPFHEVTDAPYGFEHLFETAGEYSIKAIAYDDAGNTAQDEVTITIYPPQSPYGGTAHAIPGIIQIENYDIGGNGFAYYDDSEGNDGGADFRTDEDVDLEDCSDVGGGYNLGWSTVGEWLEYTVNVETAGSYDIVVRAANTVEGKTISLAIDDTDIATDIAIPNTTDWQAWEDVLIEDIQLEAGEQVLKITIGGGDYINLNYMSFTLRPLPVDPIQLHAGWNMIGYPYTSNATVEDALSSIIDNLLFVKDDDGYFDANGTPDMNSLTELQYGRGYYVKVDADCELSW